MGCKHAKNRHKPQTLPPGLLRLGVLGEPGLGVGEVLAAEGAVGEVAVDTFFFVRVDLAA